MSLETPRNVCAEGRTIVWSPVACADGYDIHYGEDSPESPYPIHLESLQGNLNTSYTLETDELDTSLVRVVAYATDNDNGSIRSKKSAFAGQPFSAKGKLLLHDRFEDLSNWLPRYPYWKHPTNNELQEYTEDNLILDPDRGLVIEALKDSDGNWTSGLISGPVNYYDDLVVDQGLDEHFPLPEGNTYTYGYFKALIEMENVNGTLPAFWLLNEVYDGITPEIDIMEMVSGKIHQNYHRWQPERNSTPNPNPLPLIEGLNSYGLLWEPDRLCWDINGRPVHEITGSSVPNQPMYPLINLAIGGNWPGNPDPEVEKVTMIIREFFAYAL